MGLTSTGTGNKFMLLGSKEKPLHKEKPLIHKDYTNYEIFTR